MNQFNEQHHVTTGKRRALIMAIVLMALALGVGIFGNRYKAQQEAVDLSPRSARIEYEVTGSTSEVEISYLNDLAYIDSRVGAPPWRFSFRAPHGRELRIEVTNRGDGTIGCTISTGGRIISSQTESVTERITCMAIVPTAAKD
jgi:hypothetical protein